jgi:predicted phage terminase large subunit-like protein
MVFGRRVGDTLYVMRVVRKQLDVTRFLDTMEGEVKRFKAPLRFYYGGTELGVANFIQQKIPGFSAIQAKEDKVTRSTKTRQAWRLGKIVVPEPGSEHWTPEIETFVDEVTQFTGVHDPHDDCVDALAALHDQLFGANMNWADHDKWQSKMPGFSL